MKRHNHTPSSAPKHSSVLGAVACLTLLTACSGGGNREHAPQVSTIANQNIDQDTSTDALSFTASDLETSATQLQVTATSSNTTLVPQTGLVLAGTGGTRTLRVTPATDQSGSTQITLTVTDGSGRQTQTQFTLTVRDTRVAFLQYSLAAFNATSDTDPIDVNSAKFVFDSDDQDDAYDAQLQ